MSALDKITNQQKILIVIFVVIGLYFYFNMLLLPKNKMISEIKEEIAQKETKLTDYRNKAKRLDQLQAELEASQQELKTTEKKLPRTKEVPSLIKSITKSAENQGIAITTLGPRPPISHQYFSEHSYSMNLSTTYHGLGKFLEDICQYERILKVTDVNISGKAPSKDDPSTINTTFSLLTYTYLE